MTRWIDRRSASTVAALCLAAGLAYAQDRASGPQVITGFYLSAPVQPRVIAYMPDAVPPATLPPLPRVLPTEITVLSTALSSSPAVKTLGEPAAPAASAPAKPAAAPATPAAAPTATKPAATPAATTPTATAAKPAPTAAAAAPAASTPTPTPIAPVSAATAITAPVAAVTPDASLQANRGERFEIRMPGSGWTYLGDESGRDGVRFETRRFENGEAAFALNPEKAGSYLLRFQRQDPVELTTVTKLVAVTVVDPALPAAAGSSAVSSPASASTGASASTPAASTPAATGATAATGAATTAGGMATTAGGMATPAATTAAAPASAAPDASTASGAATVALSSLTEPAAILAYARDELGASRIRSALDALDRYVALFPYGNDELFYLYGIAYEQDTPFRNIKKAYEYYKRVRDEYPRSKRWREAADRIAYLERHYFGLR